MYNKKPTNNKQIITFFKLALLALALTHVNATCLSDLDCTAQGQQNGYCVLYSPTASGTCSCRSGYGGSCDNLPGSSTYPSTLCTPSPEGSGAFVPSLVSYTIANSKLEIQIACPYQTGGARDTSVLFGEDVQTPCDYPYGNGISNVTWRKLSATPETNCSDLYVGSIPIATAFSSCGFSSIDRDDRYFLAGSVKVQRNFDVQIRSGVNVISKIQSGFFRLSYEIPAHVTLHSNISVFGSMGILTSGNNITYDPITPAWILTSQTLLRHPFALAGPVRVTSDSTNRALTVVGFANQRPQSCDGQNDCYQVFEVTFGGLGSSPTCTGLSNGIVIISGFITCQTLFLGVCPIALTPVTITVQNINSGDICSEVYVSPEIYISLNSSNEPDSAYEITNFNVGETAYFLVTCWASSPQISIQSVTLLGTARFNGIPVDTNVIPTKIGNEASFSLKVDNLPQGILTISVDVQVIFATGKKGQKQSSSEIDLTGSKVIVVSNDLSGRGFYQDKGCIPCIVVPIVVAFILLFLVVGSALLKEDKERKRN
eukprot:TRINITY_DN6452_c0_g1_i1.p1 TRINITY_DN6452_c0_g1~~TRINITY_DN6452_c0_g1_i1.p1  ORF type:complete len:542 (+),score=86.97 TRINITY_DN6452_c0_g1_i1:43-1668(+)